MDQDGGGLAFSGAMESGLAGGGIAGDGARLERQDRLGLDRGLAADVLEHQPRLARRRAHIAGLRPDQLPFLDHLRHAQRPFSLLVRSLPWPR